MRFRDWVYILQQIVRDGLTGFAGRRAERATSAPPRDSKWDTEREMLVKELKRMEREVFLELMVHQSSLILE